MKLRAWLRIGVLPLFLGIVPGINAYGRSEVKNVPPAITKASAEKICLFGEKVEQYPFYVYKDGNSPQNHFHASGAMGDFHDISVDLNNRNNPYSGVSCVKITYTPGASQESGWVGLYWQYPANNWADKPLGYDLRRAKKLTFWARGKEGGEVISTFQVGGIFGAYGDTGSKSIGPIVLSKQWEFHTIDLYNLNKSITVTKENRACWPFMEPLSRISGGFCWATSLDANQGRGITFYLDEIRFESEPSH